MYQFKGTTYTFTTVEAGKEKARKTGRFFYKGENIELEDGTKLLFRNGAIIDASQNRFTKQ